MDASAFTARRAGRRLRCLRLRLTAGAGPPLLVVSLVGWALLLASGGLNAGGHLHHGMPGRGGPAPVAWLLMLVAMMPPLLSDAVHHLWTRSVERRRWRAILLFAGGYVFVWMTAGWLLAAGVTRLAPVFAPGWRAAAATVLLAALWQTTPAKQRCLNRCHARPPLGAPGTASDLDAVRYGLATGGWCLGSCWALMLVPGTMGSAHAAAMMAAMVVMVVERHAPRRPQGVPSR